VIPDGSSTVDGKVRGTEGGPCYPNNTCNAGLKCVNGVCVKTTDGPLPQPDAQPQPDKGPPPCNPPGHKILTTQGSTAGDWTVALESKTSYHPISITGGKVKEAAAAFDYNVSPDQVAGFVISRQSTTSSVSTEADSAAADVQKAVYGTFTTQSKGKLTTSHDGFQRVSSLTLDLQRNSGTKLGWIRSLVMAALLKTTTTKLQGLPQAWGSNTTRFIVRMAVVLRADSRVIVIGAVTARSVDMDLAKETALIAGDIASGSGLARSGKSTSDTCHGQTVSAPPKNMVDIIWVMDESGSMQTKRANIATNAASFFKQAQQRGLDFRMGVTNVCSPNGSYASAVGKFCSVASSNQYHDGGPDNFLLPTQLSTFSACINNPPGYEQGYEYGLLNAREAVKRHLPRGNSKSKIRKGAQVVIIVVTDEAPQSLKSGTSGGFLNSADLQKCTLDPTVQSKVDSAVKPYSDYLSGKSDAGAKIDHYQVIGGACGSTGCSNQPEIAHGYKELAQAFSGKLYDVCASDLGSAVTDIINGIVATGAPSLLTEIPISASVAVALDGKTLTRSRVSGFYHPPLTKQIVFSGSQPKAGSKVVISYKRWK
jgi:hypothetical protein